MDSSQNLAQVINSTQITLDLIRQLHLTISSSGSELSVMQSMNKLAKELDNTTNLADKCNIQVPMEVIKLIDEGKDPGAFTREVLNSCSAKNQITQRKIDILKRMKRHMVDELDQAFPDEIDAYRKLRATSTSARSY